MLATKRDQHAREIVPDATTDKVTHDAQPEIPGRNGSTMSAAQVPAAELAPQPSGSPHQTSSQTAAFSPTMSQQTSVNVNVAMPTIQFNAARHGHGFFVRALWFLAVGWWLSGLMIVAGYVSVATLVLLPVGLWFLNRVPQAQTLRERSREFTSEFRDGAIVFTEGTIKQVAWYWRLLYLPLGLVLGAVWLVAAWILGVLLITLPLSIWMIDRATGVITLQRH